MGIRAPYIVLLLETQQLSLLFNSIFYKGADYICCLILTEVVNMARRGRPPRGRSLVAGKNGSGISQPNSPRGKNFDCHWGSLGEQ